MTDTAETWLKRTVFIVEANSFEQHTLWRQHAIGSPYVTAYNYGEPLKWEQMDGLVVQVGKIGKRPCCVSMTWVKIDGCMVMFYDDSSQVRDSVQTEKWLDKHFNAKWDGTRPARCDAFNFGHCLEAIRQYKKKNL